MTQVHLMAVTPAMSSLPVRSNSRASRDYILSLSKTVTVVRPDSGAACEFHILVRYVPDRLVCDTAKMCEYFEMIAARNRDSAVEFANAITDDFCNDLIPRWVCVSLTLSVDGIQQSVLVSEKQPLWENPALLSLSE